MKISIYIVDDETLAIKYFKYLLAETGLECEVIGEAANGVKAVAEIIRLNPDIVFTDISMPVMDGLELAEKILKKVSPKIFFLTSYRDFDYVKRGINLGIADYILKNDLSEETLRELLEKTVQDLMIEKKQQHLILSHNIRAFLLSETTDVEDHVYEHLPMQRYAMISVVKGPRICLKHQEIWEKLEGDCYELQKLTYPKGIRCSAFVEISQTEFCGIFFIQGEVTDSQVLLTQAAEQIREVFSGYGRSCKCIISETMHHFFELQSGYQRVKHISDYIYAHLEEHIYHAANLHREGAKKVPADLWLEKLSKLMRDGKREEASAAMAEFFALCRKSLNIWEYTENLNAVYHLLKSYVKDKQISPEKIVISDSYSDTQAVESSFLRCVESIYEEEDKYQGQNLSHYIQQALHYIQQNYRSDISIPDIAGAVKISEGHLRRLFKQELDTKVVDYLTEYRLECAKQLMKDLSENTAEIWQKTGFTSAQYFSYVFKKKEGILPKDYLKQWRNR